jgi:hypothetical protein
MKTPLSGADKKHVLRANRQQTHHVSGRPDMQRSRARVLDLLFVGRSSRAGDAVGG